MSKQATFELSVNSRSDGTLESAYIQLSKAKTVRTEELIESVLIVDYGRSGVLVGIEILAPVKISQVQKIAKHLEVSRRKAFRKFVKSSAPPALVTA